MEMMVCCYLQPPLLQLELESMRAQFRTQEGTYRAYMCKRCGFGPIDHGKCNDLKAHHHQAIGKGWWWRRARGGRRAAG